MPESKSRKKAVQQSAPAAKQAPQGNPSWLVPTMLGLMLLGLVWIVVTYVTRTAWPVESLGNWNLAVGFGLIIAGFALTTRWR